MWKKIKGGEKLPPRASPAAILKAMGFGVIALSVVAALAHFSQVPLVMGSFGATCVICGTPDSPFAQPRNIIFGHVISTAIGLICLNLWGAEWWSMALAIALAIGAMQWGRIVHPPAGSNPVIVMLAQPGWSFLLFPTLTGAVLLTLTALMYHNLQPGKSYPRYW